ncbi:CBS domain-containing protein [Actinoplanes sp. NPDC020271]|uniref:CBS domain-containing protein n=1 Tax=Actinoplanes sp. NPDC020271 TaxID=3363896 RepID=UPI0037972D2E
MNTWHVKDVMTADVVSAHPDTPYRQLVNLMTGRRINALPVVDDDRHVLGVVSKSDLLQKIEYGGAEEPHWYERRQRAQWRKAVGLTAAELMTAPAVVALARTGVRAAALRMEEAGVKQLPVEDSLGRLVGMVSRGDLLKEHLRPDTAILADARTAIDEVLLTENVAEVSAVAADGVVTLTGHTERWSSAALTVRTVRLVPGVVDVVDRITFAYDDHHLADPAPAYFIA